MPFDPTKPAASSLISSAELRAQFSGLAELIASNHAATSANSNGVSTLVIGVSDPPSQSDVQQIADKLDELITALRR
jgi:hypothetical protein